MTKICVCCKKERIPYDNTRSFHKFPNDPELRAKWMQITGITKVSTCSTVCSDHFEPNAFHQTDGYTTVRRLLSNAIPTPILPNIEHSYSMQNLISESTMVHLDICNTDDISETSTKCNVDIDCALVNSISIKENHLINERKNPVPENKNLHVKTKKFCFKKGFQMVYISREDFVSDPAWDKFISYTICKKNQLAAMQQRCLRREKKLIRTREKLKEKDKN